METFPPNAMALALWNPNKVNADGSTGGWEVQQSISGAGLVDASPDSYAVTQHDTIADPNGPFIGIRFDAAGAVSLVSGNGAVHALNVSAGEYWPGTVLRINDTGTALTDAQMVGFKR